MSRPSHGLAISATLASLLALVAVAFILAYPGLVSGKDDGTSSYLETTTDTDSVEFQRTLETQSSQLSDEPEDAEKNDELSTDTKQVDDDASDNSGSSSTSTLSSEELATLPTRPNARISVNGDEKDLHGDRHIDVKVDVPDDERIQDQYVKSIEVFLRRLGSPVELFIGTARQKNDDTWRARWNTTQTPNGDYRIMARSSTIFGDYIDQGPRVTVNNEPAQGTTRIIQVPELSDDILREISQGAEDLLTAEQPAALTADQPVSAVVALPVSVDSDGDGLSDEEEGRLGTDPNNPDTDNDGYIDGLEIANGYNPLIPSPGDKVVFSQPTEAIGEVRSDIYSISSIIVVEQDGQETLRITGQARPLVFVTLFIYSELPTIVTVHTDADGKFTYELSKTLDDGDHRIYIGLADTSGYLVEKSQPFAFVKTAQAITIADLDQGPAVTATPAAPLSPQLILLTTIVILLAAVVLVVIILLFILRDKEQRQGRSAAK